MVSESRREREVRIRLERASRASPEAWRHWLETLLVGHSSSAEIPTVPASDRLP